MRREKKYVSGEFPAEKKEFGDGAKKGDWFRERTCVVDHCCVWFGWLSENLV